MKTIAIIGANGSEKLFIQYNIVNKHYSVITMDNIVYVALISTFDEAVKIACKKLDLISFVQE